MRGLPPFRLRRHRERALLRFPLRRPVVRAFAGTGADGITGLLVRVSTEEEFTAFTRLPATAAGGSPARAALLDPALLDLAHLSQLAALPFFAGALVPVLDGGAWLPRLTRARAGGRAGAVPPHASLRLAPPSRRRPGGRLFARRQGAAARHRGRAGVEPAWPRAA
jgi:hypothetical protein